MRYRRLIPALRLVAAVALAATGVRAAGTAAVGCTDNGRACLEAVARSYIAALLAHDGAKVPLAADVRRSENALTNAKGDHEVRESFVRTDMVESTGNVRLFTDVDKGEVIALFLLNVDLKDAPGGTAGATKAGDTEYKVAVTKPAGTYTVHEAERFRISDGKIHEIEIIAHVEDGKGKGAGWPVERDAAIRKAAPPR